MSCNYLKSGILRSDEEVVGVNDDFTDYEDPLNSCDIADELQMLKLRVNQLQAELDSTKKSLAKSLFCLENIKENEELVKFYTGFPCRLCYSVSFL